MVGVVLEGEGNVGLATLPLASQEAAGGQDYVLGEGDVQATVALNSSRPCVIGEVDVCSAAAQIVSTGVCEQPAIHTQNLSSELQIHLDHSPRHVDRAA